jgi:hypothetical protein
MGGGEGTCFSMNFCPLESHYGIVRYIRNALVTAGLSWRRQPRYSHRALYQHESAVFVTRDSKVGSYSFHSLVQCAITVSVMKFVPQRIDE